MTEPIAPTMEAIARGLDQNSEQLHGVRERLDTHIEATGLYFAAFEKQFDGLRDTLRPQHMLVSADIAAARRDIAAVEEHVALLTAMVTAQGQRLDGMDQRLDGLEQRLDGMDQRLDGLEQRLDRIETRLDGLTAMVEQIRDAILPGKS